MLKTKVKQVVWYIFSIEQLNSLQLNIIQLWEWNGISEL